MSELGNIGGSLGNSHYFWIVTGKLSSDVLIKYTRVTGRSSSVHGMFLKYYVIVSREKNGMITMKRENTMIRPFGDNMPGGGCPKSRIVPFAIVYFGKKYYLTVAKTKHYSNG